MNSVNLIGRLTSEPEVKFTTDGRAMAKFSIAIDRPHSQEKREALEAEGKSTADFPRIVVWGKTAETVGKYLKKGQPIGVSGRVTTGSYTKEDGSKVYTTDISASRVRFFPFGERAEEADNDNMDTEIENVPF